VQAGFLWRHTFSRCKYPPAVHSISLHPHPCSALSNPRARRPRSAPRQKAGASLHCLCSFLLSSRSLIVILRASFAIQSLYPQPSTTGLSWAGSYSTSLHTPFLSLLVSTVPLDESFVPSCDSWKVVEWPPTIRRISQLRLKDETPTTPTPTRHHAQHASRKPLQSTRQSTLHGHRSTTPQTTTDHNLKYRT